MRIVIDMQGAQTESRFRGIGRYTLAFTHAVIRNRSEHQIFLALSDLFPETIEPIRAEFQGIIPQENIVVWGAPSPVLSANTDNEARRNAAELIREAFIASLRPDVIHVCSLFEGYIDDAVSSIGRFDRSTPVSVSLYDLIPLLNPTQYLDSNPTYADFYNNRLAHLKNANACLAISEFTRLEGLKYLDVSSEKFITIATGIETQFQPIQISPTDKQDLLQKYAITRPFILYTGGADERKNLPRLIQAYASLPEELRQGHQLVFAGKIVGTHFNILKEAEKTAGLKGDEFLSLGFVSDAELIALYNLCKLFVFPSWHEGFGLPAVEAMACGAAVIGANNSCLPEVINLESALFDPYDASSIAAKMIEVLTNEKFRLSLVTHGIKQAKSYSWDSCAKKAFKTWEALVAERHKVELPVKGTQPKPKLAFVSPLPPEQTGIADYSAGLIPALSEYYQVELITVQTRVDNTWIERSGSVRDVSWFRSNFHEFERVVYQLGNSPFHEYMLELIQEKPGVVVLHDFYLSALMAWREQVAGVKNAWKSALYESHGYSAIQLHHREPEQAKIKYPTNFRALQSAIGVIIHSEHARELGSQWYGPEFTKSWIYAPIARLPPKTISKELARSKLRLELGQFIVCSFGFLDETKLNHRLIDAWVESNLSKNINVKLIFVGGNESGAYARNLLTRIKDVKLESQVQFSGFTDTETYHLYLAAADMAVQLRANSRGETSAAVLDCMNYGIPTVVNANGSMAYLDQRALKILPDDFQDGELIESLEFLYRHPKIRDEMGAISKVIIDNQHSPEVCASTYVKAIELSRSRLETSTSSLIQRVAHTLTSSAEDSVIVNLAHSIATSIPLERPAKCLLLDITATYNTTLHTGIERVARAITFELLRNPPVGFRVEPVYLSNVDGDWHFKHARSFSLSLLGCQIEGFTDEIVDPTSGDILVSLDLSGDLLVAAQKSGLHAKLRNYGVSIFSMVFDLLPVNMESMFPPGASENHAAWLRSISCFDGAICISETVATDLVSWQGRNQIEFKGRRPYQINWIPLGSDISGSAPTSGVPIEAEEMTNVMRSKLTFLMVGTIEPRKGYMQTIRAFNLLWAKNIDVNLVIVGREGWVQLPSELRRDIPDVVHSMQTHPELNKRLFWLSSASDEYLNMLYEASSCLIAASYGEGFGLPLIEANRHNLPIISRDIPVFREVMASDAFYFSGSEDHSIANAIEIWLQDHGKTSENRKYKQASTISKTWKNSVHELKKVLINRI